MVCFFTATSLSAIFSDDFSLVYVYSITYYIILYQTGSVKRIEWEEISADQISESSPGGQNREDGWCPIGQTVESFNHIEHRRDAPEEYAAT